MAIVRFEPFRGFEGIARRLNNIFDDFEQTAPSFGLNVSIDISEDENKLYIHAEAPGMQKDDIKLSIDDSRVLTIKGEKKRGTTEENKNYIRVERSFGTFSRSFYIPENFDIENVNANFENGVLEINLNKVEPQKPKQIEISIK